MVVLVNYIRYLPLKNKKAPLMRTSHRSAKGERCLRSYGLIMMKKLGKNPATKSLWGFKIIILRRFSVPIVLHIHLSKFALKLSP